MVSVHCGFRTSFKDEIKEFCSFNDIKITYYKPMGWFDSYNVSCKGRDFDKLDEFNKKLEKNRKDKGFWYRLFN